MRKLTLLVLAAVLVLAALPVRADVASAVDCGPDDGRARLTVDGDTVEFEAPVVTWPGLASPVNTGVGPTTALRSAPFSYTVDLAPAADGMVTFRLDWGNVSDFDIFIFDDEEGFEIGRSDASNIDGGQTTFEEATVEVAHCQRVTAYVRSWAGSPAEELSLSVEVAPGTRLLACAEGDPAPGCAGKAAGEAPEPTPEDARTRLYLGGAPGQAAMLWRYARTQADNAATQALPRATMGKERPTGGVPNGHTRAASGFRKDNATAHGNPFLPHWSYALAEPTDLTGTINAVLWASSRTVDATSVFYVDLWIDGALVKSVEIPGSAIGQEPTRLAVAFTDVDAPEASEVTLQAATEPVATSGGQVNNPRDAEVTVHYGSVQFPAMVVLP